MNKFSFEDEEMQDDGEQISTYGMSYECQDLQSVANDESYPLEERDEAAEQMEQLADAGDAYAQYIIGTAYRDGGLLIPDTAKAQKLLERAAEQDLTWRSTPSASCISDDADVHDPAKGIYWLKRSADNGNDFAAYRLGKEYLSGKNVSKDTSTAAEYLRQAANNGNAYAQYLLGKLTLMGEGVPKDPDAAYEWFAAARDNGHAYAEFFHETHGARRTGAALRPAVSHPAALPHGQYSSGTTPRPRCQRRPNRPQAAGAAAAKARRPRPQAGRS